jgi:hypothetical protein
VYLINVLPKNGDPEDPASLEEERRSAIRDGFMELLRKEFLEKSSQINHNGAPREDKSGILYSTEW